MSIASWVLRRPLLLLGSTGLITLLLGLGVFALEIRTDGATIYPLNDPVVELTQQDRLTFRDPEQIILLLSSRHGGPAVASPEGFREIAFLHRELDRLPAVRRGRVRSLASLPDPPEELTPISVVGRFLDTDIPHIRMGTGCGILAPARTSSEACPPVGQRRHRCSGPAKGERLARYSSGA